MARYSDAALTTAVAAARSWRGVLRQLGLPPQSAGALRSARRRADELGLDYGHFTGQRRWSDRDLADAVRQGSSWTDVLDRLALARTSGSAQTMLKAHAARLGLDVRHLSAPGPAVEGTRFVPMPDPRQLRRAGPLLAASWFVLCGYDVAWPLEPCRYDLVVTKEGNSSRIQVKTTTSRTGGSWAVRISNTRRRGVAVYAPDEVDQFFIVDGDLNYYLIPLPVVGGYQVVQLRRYGEFVLRRDWLDAA